MRTIYWYCYFCISLLFMTPALFSLRRRKASMEVEAYEKLVNETAGRWAAKQLRNSGAQVHLSGEEKLPPGPVLFVGNHQGNFDIAILMACVPKSKGYVSKAEMLKVPLLRTWMRELRCVFMSRSSPRDSLRAIAEGVEILKSGYSLSIFPEGTRSRGGPVKEFKAGSFRLAFKAKVPIVPFTIDGSYKLMEECGNRIRPADVWVTIHDPINTAELTKEEAAALPQRVQEIITSALRSPGES